VHKISLFQTAKNWNIIKEKVLDLVNTEHQSGSAQNGELVFLLENRLAQQFNRKYCVTMASCTDALTAAMIALDLPADSRVGVSDYTFTASAHAIARAGYIPVALDVDDNYCLDTKQDLSHLSAIMPVDVFGNMTQLDHVSIPVVMDSAQSIESYDGQDWSASKGIMSCLSFSPSKTISSWGSGGAVLTNDESLYKVLRKLRLHGKITNNDIAIHPGMNSMMSSFEAACVWVGLDYSKEWQLRRYQIAQYLLKESKYQSGIDLSLPQHTLHKLVFRDKDRDNIVKQFHLAGIDAGCHYQRLIHQEKLYADNSLNCTHSQYLSNTSFTVPNQQTLTDYEVEKIAEVLR